VKTTQTNS